MCDTTFCTECFDCGHTECVCPDPDLVRDQDIQDEIEWEARQ